MQELADHGLAEAVGDATITRPEGASGQTERVG